MLTGKKIVTGTILQGAQRQLVMMLLAACCIFVLGLFFGSHWFDPHGDSAAETAKPWDALTQSRMKALPGLRTKAQLGGFTGSTGGKDIEEGSSGANSEAEAEAAEAEPEPISALAAKGPSFYLDFATRQIVEMDAPLDAAQVSLGAWIYLDSRDKSSSIKMIASNRASGCTVDMKHRGWSFFVNNWETNDRALVLEWRNSRASGDGCARLSSDPNTIPYDQWVHVGFSLPSVADGSPGPKDKVMLFLNGELLKAAPGARKDADAYPDQDASSDSTRLTIGASGDKQMFFNGKISQLFIARTIVTPKQLVAAARLLDFQGWKALSDAGKSKMVATIFLGSMNSIVAAGSAGAALSKEASGLPLFLTGTGDVVGDLCGNAKLAGGSPAGPTLIAAFSKLRGGSKDERPSKPAVAVAVKQPSQASTGGSRAAAGDVTFIPSSIKRTSVPGPAAPSTSTADYSKGGNQWVAHMIGLPADMASGDVNDRAHLAAGTWKDEVSAEEMAKSDETGRVRAAAVKAAMQHAWKGYREKAWGFDELKPRGGYGQDNWAGVGMTLVDSLDTLWLMGMKKEFDEAKEWVASRLDFNKHSSVSVFETTIRALGGLLAAYDLSGERVFLDKAKDLGNRLMPAFNTPTGIPRSSVVLATGQSSSAGWTGGSAVLAELGTVQVEFRKLGKDTGDSLFARKAEQVIEKMDNIKPADGLYPIYISPDSGTATASQVTFGALGDSFYEYLIKVWVQGGRKESLYRRMYDAAMQGMTSKLLKRSRPSNLLYVADWDGGGTQDKMDHLVCFVPGMLALGAFTAAGTAGEAHAARDLQNAKALAYTCWQMYERQATGIAPEFVEFPGGADLIAAGRAPFYILRPEAAESLFILHQLTGHPIYREWGWKMFQAIDRYCRVEFGYGAHPDVRDPSRTPDDRMESFFLAETLKYLYLLQDPDHPISLQKYVFNTEAHPTRVFEE